jgi:alpha-D-ribose 1-methylphosphonate 5-triphosphate synthase subunit PhnL
MENFYYKIILKDEPTPKIVNEQNKNKILQLIKQKEQLIEI